MEATRPVRAMQGRRENRWNSHIGVLLIGVICLSAVGCSVTRGITDARRTPLEQLLLTQSLHRSLENAAVPLRLGDTIAVETAWPATHSDFAGDKDFAHDVFKNWFAEKGLLVDAENAVYLVRITLHAFGLDKADTFFGIPPIQSLLIPFATPELTVYGSSSRRGYTRFALNIYDKGSGRLLEATPISEAAVFFTHYTLLFIVTWQTTDMVPPPL